MELKVLIYLTLLYLGVGSVLCQRKKPPNVQDEPELPYNDRTVLIEESSRAELFNKCNPSITEVSCQSYCSGDLIFEDNFNSLSRTIWQREVRIGLKGSDQEFVAYLDRDENCLVNKGILKIKPTLLTEIEGYTEEFLTRGTLDLRSSCTALREYECSSRGRFLPPIVSARIGTKVSFQFRYGRVEVRAKLPKGDWLYPQPAEYLYGQDNYASGQLRVAFANGNPYLLCNGAYRGGNCLQGGALLTDKPQRDYWLRSKCQQRHFGDGFHVYSLTWTDREIILELDGKEYDRILGKFEPSPALLPHSPRWRNGGFMAPFDRKFYITLGLGVGGRTEFPDSCTNAHRPKPWENSDVRAVEKFWEAKDDWLRTWDNESMLEVDYVRVYAV